MFIEDTYAGSYASYIAVRESEVSTNPNNHAIVNIHTLIDGYECNADEVRLTINSGLWNIDEYYISGDSPVIGLKIDGQDYAFGDHTYTAKVTYNDEVFQGREVIEIDEYGIYTVIIELESDWEPPVTLIPTIKPTTTVTTTADGTVTTTAVSPTPKPTTNPTATQTADVTTAPTYTNGDDDDDDEQHDIFPDECNNGACWQDNDTNKIVFMFGLVLTCSFSAALVIWKRGRKW